MFSRPFRAEEILLRYPCASQRHWLLNGTFGFWWISSLWIRAQGSNNNPESWDTNNSVIKYPKFGSFWGESISFRHGFGFPKPNRLTPKMEINPETFGIMFKKKTMIWFSANPNGVYLWNRGGIVTSDEAGWPISEGGFRSQLGIGVRCSLLGSRVTSKHSTHARDTISVLFTDCFVFRISVFPYFWILFFITDCPGKKSRNSWCNATLFGI